MPACHAPGPPRRHHHRNEKDRPFIDRHPQKNRQGWLLNEQEQLIVCFGNAMPSAHTAWIELEIRPMRGSGQPIVRRMLRHNAIETWTHMQKQAGSAVSPGGD